MAEGAQTPEIPVNQPESPRQTPTEASEGFLTGWKNKLIVGLPLATGLGIFFNGSIPGDIGRGDYKTAAIKGVIAAASATPLILKVMRLR